MKQVKLNIVFSLQIIILVSYFQFIVPQCSFNYFTSNLSPADYLSNLGNHNDIRNKVALGNQLVAGVPLPKAANMVELVWNDNLAKIAQAWALQLVNNCSGLDNNPNRNLIGFSYVGENIYWRGSKNDPGTPATAVFLASESWKSEVNDFSPSFVNKFTETETYHFTQQIWAGTTDIGCGYAHYKDGIWAHAEFVVCNYGVGGNMLGSPIYITGEPCSQCPTGYNCSTSTSRKGLCSNGGVPIPTISQITDSYASNSTTTTNSTNLRMIAFVYISLVLLSFIL